jgi:hypothetical protein
MTAFSFPAATSSAMKFILSRVFHGHAALQFLAAGNGRPQDPKHKVACPEKQ